MKKYQLTKKIGQGAMGAIYEARDNLLDRAIAIKQLKFDDTEGLTPEEHQEIQGRFLQEARAAARLNHPNIITIYDVVPQTNPPYIAMELLQGKPLSAWLKAGRRFSLTEVVKIGLQICKGLHYAHSAGVVHRDIKPANLVINNELLVKIVDFGIAQLESGALVKTTAGSFLGTPSYAAPEQFGDLSQVDGRTDLYAVGAVLYRMLAERPPFQGQQLNQLISAILYNEPTPISTLAPAIPTAVTQVITHALAKEPAHRFQTGLEMAKALKMGFESAVNLRQAPSSHSLANDTTTPHASMTALLEDRETALDFSSPIWVRRLLTSWKAQKLAHHHLDKILEDLLSTPLYTAPFSGALQVGDRFLLLIWQGYLLHAFDEQQAISGEAALLTLQRWAKKNPTPLPSTLYTPSEHLTDLPLLITSCFGAAKLIHQNLDSALLDLSGFLDKMAQDRFTGIIHLRYEQGETRLCFFAGQRLAIWQSQGLDEALLVTQMADILIPLKSQPFQTEVSATRFQPIRLSKALRLFTERVLTISYEDSAFDHTTLLMKKGKNQSQQQVKTFQQNLQLRLQPSKNPTIIPVGAAEIHADTLLQQDFCYRFSQWFLADLFTQLIQRKQQEQLKYITNWIPEITQLQCCSFLEGEGGEQVYYDLVTRSATGKILHLIRWGAAGDETAIRDFIAETLSVKKARLATGDIGGALYVTNNAYTDDALAYYGQQTTESKKLLGLQVLDALTGYQGFIRLSKNRGFHLCLVMAKDNGFQLIAPS